MINCVSETPDYTVVFAGISGVGKSTAGNFFLNGKHLEHEFFTPTTKECSSATSTICGKRVKIIDTPDTCDPNKSSEEILQELNRSLTLAKDGINAIAFVMSNIHYNEAYEDIIMKLLCFKPLIPFLFVLITHAKHVGATKAKADEYIQEMLLDPNCHLGFKNLMELVENRVVMVESLNTTEEYRIRKSEEFMAMITHIHQSNGYNAYGDVLTLEALEMDEEEPTSKQY